ncbi:MAG TPA: DUF1697 domain-containing protein [Jatrophihabitans sp.]|nr:DUF1697 domain-containing protein [Jatrophihabitans sp.]
MAEQVIALLRGINVGRAKRVAMADLRALLTDLGYDQPRTLLNSGNAVFGCRARQSGPAAERIEAAIADRLGVRCTVITRTASELAAVVAADPFAVVASDPARYLVGFAAAPPVPEVVRQLHARDFGAERVRIVGREAYLWCAAGIAESELTKALGSVIGVELTTRNWNTVLKLAALAGVG